MKKTVIMMIGILVALPLFARITSEILDEMLMARMSVDLVNEDEQSGSQSLTNEFAGVMEEMNVDGDSFLIALCDYMRIHCVDASLLTNEIAQIRMDGAIGIIREFGTTNCYSSLAFVMTNSLIASQSSLAGMALAENSHYSKIIFDILRDATWRNSSTNQYVEAYKGLCCSFRVEGGSEIATNMVLALIISELDGNDMRVWETADYSASKIWSGYETSSNRYQYITAALAADPPPVNTNYLLCVKAELEALPPGTMQQLSTNFLNGVWD